MRLGKFLAGGLHGALAVTDLLKRDIDGCFELGDARHAEPPGGGEDSIRAYAGRGQYMRPVSVPASLTGCRPQARQVRFVGPVGGLSRTATAVQPARPAHLGAERGDPFP
ncbi:hypothetical protein Xph01_54400 [Micromonospora phaseoli]|nr:hypothetical protein Xph01_54400 [Micromonospora phaseoli]